MRIREACEKLADSAIAHAGILIGASGISRLWQGHVDIQVARDRDVFYIMAATDMTYDEVMKAYQEFPGDWNQFYGRTIIDSLSDLKP